MGDLFWGWIKGEIMEKKNVGNWILFFIIIISVVIAVAVDYNAKVCKAKGCSKDKISASQYCRKHTCEEKNCYNYKDEDAKYCSEHEEYYRQKRAEREAEEAKKPNCHYSGCTYKAEYGHTYCLWHECLVPNCTRCVVADGLYCIKHTCIEPGCTNKATEDSGRCSSCEKAYKSKTTTKKKMTYKTKSKSTEVEWPDCDDYEDYGHFMDDWEGEMPDGSNAEDYWDDW